jgi:hypothetical protein
MVLGGNRHLYVVAAQDLFGLAYLVAIICSFAKRRDLITACSEEAAPNGANGAA